MTCETNYLGKFGVLIWSTPNHPPPSHMCTYDTPIYTHETATQTE